MAVTFFLLLTVTSIIIAVWRKELQCETIAVKREEPFPRVIKRNPRSHRPLTFKPFLHQAHFPPPAQTCAFTEKESL